MIVFMKICVIITDSFITVSCFKSNLERSVYEKYFNRWIFLPSSGEMYVVRGQGPGRDSFRADTGLRLFSFNKTRDFLKEALYF